jgi:two-component system response regulator YesN
MEQNVSTAEKYCRHLGNLCGASCVFFTLRPEPRISCSGEDWLCSCYHACDFLNTLHYGCSEAYRWNGKYVFYCPKGLVFAAASVTDEQGELSGGMVLGPVVMGEMSDTLETIGDPSLARAISALPQWDTHRVRSAQEILCAVASTVSGTPQSLYGSYVFEQEKMLSELYEMKSKLQNGKEDSEYLIRSEKQLNALIAQQDKDGAQKLLNEMLGYIFFTGQADLFTIKARLTEMLVLLSRSAIDAGAGVQEILLFNEQNIRGIEKIATIEDLSAWVTVIMRRFVQYSFDFSSIKHSDIMYKIMQYVKANYDRKITLDDIASCVYLSRSYVSSMFKEEMGEGLFAYVNRVRVEKSKVLLLNESVSLADVGGLCGFEDQSYFTKVFKSLVGVSPKKFRAGRGKPANLK